MSEKLDLKDIERRVHHSAYQDGLLELFLGGYLLLVGAMLAAESKLTPSSVFLLFLLNPLFEQIKKRYIYPRVGYVKFRAEKEADPKGIVNGMIGFLVVLLGSIGVFILLMGKEQGWNFWFDYFVPVLGAFMMAIGPFWLGQTYGLKRGYVLAVLFPLGGILIPVLGIATGYVAIGLECLLVGLISLITGTIMFTHFLFKYPPEEGALDAN